jgi:hypothetical protein
MKPIWRQSPDGRAVAATDHPDDRAMGSPEATEGNEPRLRELEPFLEACMSLAPEPSEGEQVRLGFVLFALGAADRFWSLYGLDEHRFPAYAERLLARFGTAPEKAATLVAALPQVAGDPLGDHALREGGDTLDSWLQSRDPNVVLRLKELVAQWRRA